MFSGRLLILFAVLLLAFGCISGIGNNALKEKVDAAEKISFSDYKKDTEAQRPFQPAQASPETDYTFVSPTQAYPSEETMPPAETSTSYDVLEPGSATQEDIIEITQNTPAEPQDYPQGTEQPTEPVESPQPESNALSENVAVILPSEQDYYENFDEYKELPEETRPEPKVDEGFLLKLDEIGQMLSDVSGLEVENPYKIEVSPKDTKENRTGESYLGELEPLLYFPVEDKSSPETMYEAVNTGCKGVHTLEESFFNEPNRVNIYSYYPEENTAIVFGLQIDPKAAQPLVPQESPFENPQINLYSQASTINGIFESENPLQMLGQAHQDGLIYLEGTDIPTSAKLMVAELGLKVNGEGFGLVEEQDCTEIKKEWSRLREEKSKLNCEEIQEKLADAKNRMKNFEESLAEAEKKLSLEENEVKKWEGHLSKFLKDSGLENEDVSLSPPADADSKSYANFSRHGIQIWMNGNAGAERVIEHFNKWKKDIDEYKKEIEKARIKRDAAKNIVDGLKEDITEAESEISLLQQQANDCLAKKAELESKMKNLETLYTKCLEKLSRQNELSKKSGEIAGTSSFVQLENIRTMEIVAKFEELDKEIEELEKELDGKSDEECSEYKAKQEIARAALEKARAKRAEASARFHEARALYDGGKLSESEAALADAKGLFEEAAKLAQEAKQKAQDALNEKINCKVNLEQEKKGEEAKLAEWDEWINIVRENGKVDDGKPFEMNETDAKVRLDIELRELVSEAYLENGCDCPFKLLSAAKTTTGEIYSDAIKQIGIGAMKAPIDALSPESFLGKAAQKIASHVLSYLGADSFGSYLKDAVIGELVDAILPKTDIPLIDNPASTGTSMGVGATVDDWLRGSGVQIWEFEAKKNKFQSRLCGEFDCNIKMIVIYNPNTRHMLTLIKGDCCPGVLMISTKFNEDGVSIDTKTKYFP